MTTQYDYIVVGASHNTLTCASYLAAAGFGVQVFETNSWIGGGVTTREVTAPGFRHDLHSTAHNFIQANPLIKDDELGLISKFGLEYKYPDITLASLFDDGSSVLLWYDVAKTAESIAKISKKDADTYFEHVRKISKILPMFTAGLFQPPAPFGTFMAMLEQSREGRELIGVMNKSAYDIVTEMFESEQVIHHLCKYSSEAMCGPEEKGTGMVFNILLGFMHAYKGGLPVGGSGSLSEALARCVRHHGGEVRTGAEVVKVLVEGGKAVGVRLQSGEEFRAKKGVVASVHPHVLDKFVDGIDPYIIAEAKTTQFAGYSSMNTHYALNEAPVYKALQGIDAPPPFIVELIPLDHQAFRREYDDLRYGRVPAHVSPVCATATQFDPTRAPAGKHTLYMYHFMPYELADGGAKRWDDIKESTADWMLEGYRKYTTNMGPENIIARYVDSPLDYERHSATMRHGDISGIGRYLHQFMGRRPTPELSQYAVPGIEGLYLSGPFMHPGGGVNGGGRATAVKMFKDLKLDMDKAISRAR